jgi:tetratricopeptide (TPR) repeat protein
VAPDDVREHRFLAYAYLVAHDYARAGEVVEAGLRLAPRDRKLIEYRGDVHAGRGEPDAALADWRHAVDLDPEDIGPWYSSAFLLEREARIPEAIAVWQSIIAWSQKRGYTLDTQWPTRELQRLQGVHADGR